MPDKIREAAADALDAFADIGHWVLAIALMGAAAIILVRALISP